MIEYGLKFAGISSIALGIFHIPQIWGAVFSHWDDEISSLSPLSRKLVNTVLIALGMTLVILGAATLLLMEGNSSYNAVRNWFFFFCFIFWVWRLCWQILYFPYRRLNPNTSLLILHIALIAIFALNAFAYLAPAITSRSF